MNENIDKISEKKLHLCRCYSETNGKEFPLEGYGQAIEECDEREDGTLWAGNGEYGTRVNFCPFCGYSAKVKVEIGKT